MAMFVNRAPGFQRRWHATKNAKWDVILQRRVADRQFLQRSSESHFKHFVDPKTSPAVAD